MPRLDRGIARLEGPSAQQSVTTTTWAVPPWVPRSRRGRRPDTSERGADGRARVSDRSSRSLTLTLTDPPHNAEAEVSDARKTRKSSGRWPPACRARGGRLGKFPEQPDRRGGRPRRAAAADARMSLAAGAGRPTRGLLGNP